MPAVPHSAETSPSPLEPTLFELKRLIVGQDRLLERLLVALLVGGHVIIEGVPGLAKTATVKAMAEVVSGTFGRIQFTPDLVPADLVGTRIYDPGRAEFKVELGPVFANLLLADEINRAPAKVQSALLEVMQERQVTIGGRTFPVPDPFLVLATQNPIEAEGTYPLPEAQLDRFLFKVQVDYPSFQEELVIIQRVTGPGIELRPVLTLEQLRDMRSQVGQIYVDPPVAAYAATLVAATRVPAASGLGDLAPGIAYGASPRASINLVAGARALAFLRGRAYALPQDVADIAPEVMRHRLVLSYDGIAGGLTPDTVVGRVLERYPPPWISLSDHHRAS
ncbi:MAG TPA: AAA family ATPase [Candidatus Dormibacteraeota bacterium]